MVLPAGLGTASSRGELSAQSKQHEQCLVMSREALTGLFFFFFWPAAEDPEIMKGLQHYKGSPGKGMASGAEDAAAAC